MRKRPLMTLAVVAAGGIVIGLGLLLMLAHMSKSGEAPGLLCGRLHPCSSRPNGVCSEFPEDASHYVPPLEFAETEPEEAWQALRTAIENSGGTIVSYQRPYLAATYTSYGPNIQPRRKFLSGKQFTGAPARAILACRSGR